jgi:hypothetical protein
MFGMEERRTNERRRALRAGKIVWNKGGSVLDCTVRNVSKTGVLIGVLSVVTVPDEFELRWEVTHGAASSSGESQIALA